MLSVLVSLTRASHNVCSFQIHLFGQELQINVSNVVDVIQPSLLSLVAHFMPQPSLKASQTNYVPQISLLTRWNHRLQAVSSLQNEPLTKEQHSQHLATDLQVVLFEPKVKQNKISTVFSYLIDLEIHSLWFISM